MERTNTSVDTPYALQNEFKAIVGELQEPHCSCKYCGPVDVLMGCEERAEMALLLLV